MECSRSISSASDLRNLPLAIIVDVMEFLLKANREWSVTSSTSRAVARGAAYAGSTGNQNGERRGDPQIAGDLPVSALDLAASTPPTSLTRSFSPGARLRAREPDQSKPRS